MPDEFQKKEQKEGCDRKKIKPVICSRGRDDEQAAGFVDLQTGEFTGVF